MNKVKLNPKAFDNYFTPISHQYATRSSANGCYQTFKPRTEKGKTLINFIGITIWNSLPGTITNTNFDTIVAFKSVLKEHLLSKHDSQFVLHC